jgi:hypothetical protein
MFDRREYLRPYMRVWNSRNPEKRRVNNAASRERKRDILRKAKDKPCMDCGVKYPPHVMDFDHVRGEKQFNIGTNVNRGYKVVADEVAKCDVVCANCHREREFRRRQASKGQYSIT